MSLLSIGLSGLSASSAAMNTIGNNTANVDTAGYSRQQVMTTASLQQNLGAGYIGTGTTLSDVRRIYNSYMDAQLQTSTALSADAVAYSGQASKTDTLLSDSATGVATALSQFFTQLQGVSKLATDSNSRQLFLTQAGALSARFNSISSQLSSQNGSVNSQLSSTADQVNKLSSTIASLNKQITSATATGATPNTMLDSRNEAVRQLNELVGAKVVETNGSFDVYIGTGQSLVTGSTAYTMTAAPSATDPLQYGLKLTYGTANVDVTSVITGGTIGGLLRYRSEVLTPATNELGRMALVLSDQVNSQLNQGIDLNGNFGSNLFSSINDPSQTSQRSIGRSTNTAGSGNLDVTITDTSKLTSSDYEVVFNDSGDNKKFIVRSLPDGTSVGSGSLDDNPPKQFDGFSVSLNGNDMGFGDSFKLTPTRNAASALSTVISDPRTVAAAAPLTATAAAGNSGTGTFTQPTLTTKSNIYDTTATADLRNAITSSTPLKLLFGTASGGVQSYQLLDAQGNAVLDKTGTAITGNIVPGQSNTLTFNVGYTDSASAAQSFSFDMTIAGAPNSNDAYNVALTGAGSADNRNATDLLTLQTKQTVGVNGTVGQSMSAAYGTLVSNVGSAAAQGLSDTTATAALLTQSKNSRDAVSGVSLDEEAANLIKYQQYYTASSQIIKAAQSIFSTLINSL
ncbi:Flagellar hook-associated protein FlgK [Pseudomonas savastanoi pv. glycinea]|uniref:Flagellar hook-associated protein 1 n=1 Tax=Pseudomonas phytophila TaxID=2867264 RepID=A0ABY6FAC5_9PSED|nr:flagellar hook-associated protein FlgK [Pseudomonas phytophila]RMR01147.1 Flagellar hook-associated protein FlgK [Pseudomonas savastanoi pv. glycinea]UXZ94860.1 flagellar hook-associated protein FlgK [Pseudomonas phytophila]